MAQILSKDIILESQSKCIAGIKNQKDYQIKLADFNS